MAAAKTYRLPKPDGGYLEGVTLQDGVLVGPNGNRLGKPHLFPDLEDSSTGKRVRVQTTGQTDDAGNPLPDGLEPGVETVAPGSGADDGDTRTNANGIVQKGMTLGGIKDFNSAYGLEVADASKLFDLSGAGKKDLTTKNVSYTKDRGADFSKGVDYKVPEAGKPGAFQSLPKNPYGGKDSGTFSIDEASIPQTLGKITGNPQEGADPQADSADQSRAISMKPFRGSARQQEFANRPGNRPPVSEASAEETPKTDKARSAYSRAFLDSTAKGPMGVLREAAAAQGVIRTNDGKISIKNGDSYLTYTGDKSAREVAFDLGGGQKGFDKHAGDFTSIGVPDKPEVKVDDEQTNATLEGSTEQNKAAKEFAQFYKDDLKNKNK